MTLRLYMDVHVRPFAGLIYSEQRLTTRICIDDLELLAKLEEPANFINRVVYLPL